MYMYIHKGRIALTECIPNKVIGGQILWTMKCSIDARVGRTSTESHLLGMLIYRLVGVTVQSSTFKVVVT